MDMHISDLLESIRARLSETAMETAAKAKERKKWQARHGGRSARDIRKARDKARRGGKLKPGQKMVFGRVVNVKESGPDWAAAAETLMAKYKGKTQEDFHVRAYLRAVMQSNEAQASHMRKNMLPKKLGDKVMRELIDLAGK